MDETIKVWTGYVRRSQLGPEGLCADRTEHPAHLHESSSLGRFWCTADQSQREPWRSERRRAAQDGIRPHPPITPEELAEREAVMRATPLHPLPGQLGPDLPKDPDPSSSSTRGAAQRGSWLKANPDAVDRSCPESVRGHDIGGTIDGTCTWCGKKVGRALPRPNLGRDYRTELDLEYRRVYDPDWGNDPYDV